MSELPPGWCAARLDHCAENLDSRRVPVNRSERDLRQGDVPYYGATGQVGWIDRALFDEELVLLGEDGAPFLERDRAKAYVISGPSWVNNHAHVLRGTMVSNRYLLHFLNSLDYHGLANGTTRLKLTQASMNGIKVPVAPTAEQERIVAAIEEEFSRLDAGMAALERVRQNLKRMRAAALEAGVAGRLTSQDPSDGSGVDLVASIVRSRKARKPPAHPAPALFTTPESWGRESLEALTDPVRVICYGILMPRTKVGGTIPYVEVKDLRATRLGAEGLHRTSAALHAAFPRSVLAQGDVVLAIRGSYDRAHVVPPGVAGANVSRDVARLAPLQGLDPHFLTAYLMSPRVLSYLRDNARGVAVKGVNIADLRALPVALPPLTEQRRICTALERIQSVLDEVEVQVATQFKRLATLRSAILAAAFSGKLVPQDPSDEPISILLEPIVAERASSNGHNPIRTRKARTKVSS